MKKEKRNLTVHGKREGEIEMLERYAYDMGKIAASIQLRYEGEIPNRIVTPTALGNVSERPDLIRQFFRHLDLSTFAIPGKPENWHPSAAEQCEFWLGYYHAKGKIRQSLCLIRLGTMIPTSKMGYIAQLQSPDCAAAVKNDAVNQLAEFLTPEEKTLLLI